MVIFSPLPVISKTFIQVSCFECTQTYIRNKCKVEKMFTAIVPYNLYAMMQTAHIAFIKLRSLSLTAVQYVNDPCLVRASYDCFTLIEEEIRENFFCHHSQQTSILLQLLSTIACILQIASSMENSK